MGEYAEMMLDGTCCEGCGEFLGGGSPGHPRYCSGCRPGRSARPSRADESKKRQHTKLIKGWQKLAEPLGCTVTASPHAFEIATVKGEGVQLVIYPSRSNSGTVSPRIRNNGSKDPARAQRVMDALGLYAKTKPKGVLS